MVSLINRIQPWKVSSKSSSLTKNCLQSLSGNRSTLTTNLPSNRKLCLTTTTNRLAVTMATANFTNNRNLLATSQSSQLLSASPLICGSIATICTSTTIRNAATESTATSETDDEGESSDQPSPVAEPEEPPLTDAVQDKVMNLVIGFMKQQPASNFQLTFKEYQDQRKSIKNKQRATGAATGFCSLLGATVTMPAILEHFYPGIMENPEALILETFDPMIFNGLCAGSCCLVGYALGAVLFKGIYSIAYKETYANWSARNNDFLRRLENHRVEGESDFEDDFYGEQIKTLSDYRQWCRTMDRKREAIRKIKEAKEQTA